MCGICGIIKKTEITEEDTKKVAIMNNALKHRGPNSAGDFSAAHISIAMRRLSVIDLEGGSQPLFNEDKSIALIINGEIYNYIELRDELKTKGHVFTTESDCETVIHAYEEYGDTFTQHLRGMFAFCLYDAKKNKVLLVRDRLGEKPLYIYEDGESLAFSSEMKSLITLIPKGKRKLNHNALYDYFHYQYIPDPLTAISGVRKLPPATVLEIDLADFSQSEKKYWRQDAFPAIETEPVQTVRAKLDETEKIIIRSDVPVGVSLSGGIDSSIIAILSTRYSPRKLHAFSVGYRGRPDNDERLLAKKLAEKLQIRFHDIEISQEEFLRDFDALIAALDDPIADIAAYGYWRVAERAHKENVPVLLAGFGGDELFWGYDWVRRATAYNILKRTITGKVVLVWKLLMQNKRSLLNSPIAVVRKIMRQTFGSGYLFYDITPGFDFTVQHRNELFTPAFLQKRDNQSLFSFFSHTPLTQPEIDATILLNDLWMLSNCIPLGDRTSMAHAVEMRLPLLDSALIETTLALRKENPGDYLLAPKKWLTDAMSDILPRDIMERKKRGFTPPTGQWITSLIEKNHERILDGYLVKNGILNKNFLEKMMGDPRTYQDFLYKTIVLETWLTHYL